ncbi:MAG: ImmA/IrrE family metallo-endopeptidase [Geobacteraceae bacterium]
MINISRMDLADFVSPEQMVQGILHLVPDLPIPVPIEELALALDITEIKALEAQGFEGGLITDITKSEGFILVNKNSPLQRCRFTIGHELAHFLCPWHKPLSSDGFLCSSEDMRLVDARKSERAAYMEVEANRFSALLLMPLPQFRKDVRQCKDVDIKHILDLARLYETSKEATARRYVDVQDEPCAAIVSCKGRVLRYYKNMDFPYLDVSPGCPVPRESFTVRINFSEALIVSEWEELNGSAWLSESHGRRAPMIYEQVHHQRDGYRLTLLTLAEDPEEIEEEEDLEESWTPRFKR